MGEISISMPLLSSSVARATGSASEINREGKSARADEEPMYPVCKLVWSGSLSSFLSIWNALTGKVACNRKSWREGRGIRGDQEPDDVEFNLKCGIAQECKLLLMGQINAIPWVSKLAISM
jgi:hypothetical protein